MKAKLFNMGRRNAEKLKEVNKNLENNSRDRSCSNDRYLSKKEELKVLRQNFRTRGSASSRVETFSIEEA